MNKGSTTKAFDGRAPTTRGRLPRMYFVLAFVHLIVLPLGLCAIPGAIKAAMSVGNLEPSIPHHSIVSAHHRFFQLYGVFVMLCAWPVVAYHIFRRHDVGRKALIIEMAIIPLAIGSGIVLMVASSGWSFRGWFWYPRTFGAIIFGIITPILLYLRFSRSARNMFSNAPPELPHPVSASVRKVRTALFLGWVLAAMILTRLFWTLFCGLALWSDPEMWRTSGLIGVYPYLPASGNELSHPAWVYLLGYELVGGLFLLVALFAGAARWVSRRATVSPRTSHFLVLLFLFIAGDFVFSRCIYPRLPFEVLAAAVLCAVGFPYLRYARRVPNE